MTKSDKKGKNIEILKDIVVIFFIFVICLSNIFGSTYSNLDEIWNFNFARNVSNGLVPYKDFNMVPTPLLSLICGGFFKIFGQELIVMRSLAVVFLTSIFFIVYKILNEQIEFKIGRVDNEKVEQYKENFYEIVTNDKNNP